MRRLFLLFETFSLLHRNKPTFPAERRGGQLLLICSQFFIHGGIQISKWRQKRNSTRALNRKRAKRWRTLLTETVDLLLQGNEIFCFTHLRCRKKTSLEGFFSFASGYILIKCKPEIVLDGACDGLNFPLGVVQLHVSAGLGV